jgi:hypothetical protein
MLAKERAHLFLILLDDLENILRTEHVLARSGRKWNDGLLDLFFAQDGRMKSRMRVDGVLR